MEGAPTPTSSRVETKTPRDQSGWEREFPAKWFEPHRPYWTRAFPQKAKALGELGSRVPFLFPTFPRQTAGRRSSGPNFPHLPYPQFLGLSQAFRCSRETTYIRSRRLHCRGPAKARVSGDQPGHRTLGRPCELPGPGPLAPNNVEAPDVRNGPVARLGGQGPRRREGSRGTGHSPRSQAEHTPAAQRPLAPGQPSASGFLSLF